MAFFGPSSNPLSIGLLLALAILQLLETRIPFLTTAKGNIVSIFLKLVLAYLLMGFTGSINSSYYLVLLVPMLSAGISLDVLGTFVFTLLACGSYLSFLLFIDWSEYVIEPSEVRELTLRFLFLVVAGYLANMLAESNREQARRHKSVAEQLAVANRNLNEAEAAVRRSERLAALGQLSAGLAHELRNPLGTIRASAEMLSKNMSQENDLAREMAGFISTEVDRTNSLVTRFLEFARPLRLRLSKAELGEVIDRAVANLEHGSPRYQVSVYKNYSPDIPPFLFDSELIERVMYNLLLNSVQATPAGGAITVKTRSVNGKAEISVIDRGTGIEPRHMESIFNPFFTTKPDGVGLGLAIVSKVVDEHGGRMSIESEAGKGSIFRVYLPIRTSE
jgi:two-component system sensor histidine kinase HydH